tara:strand:- start:1237 stop:1464 length:228 start_codon:yes stop_codon:yes gene_type:complete
MNNDVYIRQADENKNYQWFESRKEIIKNFIKKKLKKNNVIVNFLLKNIFSFEKYLINFINFPFGISILYYGKKIR